MKESSAGSQYYKKMFFYLKREKWLFSAGLIALLLTSGSMLLPPLIIARIIDISIPQKDMRSMMFNGIAFILVVVVSGLLSFLQANLLAKLGIKIVTDIKRKAFSHLLKAPISFFSAHPVGELISKVESDSERVRGLFSDTTIAILGNLLFFCGVYIVLMVKNSRITLILTPAIILMTIFLILLSKTISRISLRATEMQAEIIAKITEYIQGMLLIQVMNKQEKVYETLFESSRQKRLADTKSFFIPYGSALVFNYVFSVIFLIIIIRLSVPGIISGESTIGTLFVFIQYINQLVFPMLMLTENANEIQKSLVSLKRIMEISEVETEEDVFAGAGEPCFQQEIRFENVWFAYQGQDWVLEDVSLCIPKGGKIGLVGASGSGKSTVVSLLCCFYLPQRGTIYVDDIPLQELDIFAWRRQIGLILQEIFLFPGNITENIRVYNDAIGLKEINEALDIVQIRDFVRKLKDGLDTELAERGQNISQGEKQLISFARALVISPSLIIMDEATASIDMATEAKIQQAIQSVLAGKTSVIVAHRLSSILDADEILFFKKGRITHRGKHLQLMESCPEYCHNVKMQQGSTLKEELL